MTRVWCQRQICEVKSPTPASLQSHPGAAVGIKKSLLILLFLFSLSIVSPLIYIIGFSFVNTGLCVVWEEISRKLT